MTSCSQEVSRLPHSSFCELAKFFSPLQRLTCTLDCSVRTELPTTLPWRCRCAGGRLQLQMTSALLRPEMLRSSRSGQIQGDRALRSTFSIENH
mmetsp:Transcript_56204/g.182202  ORF Transcript_56204/g.182202 Transcript_56204/m.182202 type:complete len:94 (+) Transcript_56204:108-389(+)